MKEEQTRSWVRLGGLAAVSGLRAMAAPALLSRAAAGAWQSRLDGTPFGFLASRNVARVFTTLFIGEVFGDKSGLAPGRNTPPVLASRALSGAFAGAVLGEAQQRPVVPGALAGALIAMASGWSAHHLRVAASKRFAIPDVVLGLTEDAFILGYAVGVSDLDELLER